MGTSSITISDTEVEKLIKDLDQFQDTGVSNAAERGTRRLLNYLRGNVQEGANLTGEVYEKVRDSTMNMGISFSGPFQDKRIRSTVSGNRTAMNVTGESLASLSEEKKNSKEFNIGFDGARASVVFFGNAKDRGNTTKPKRDPLGLSVGLPTAKEMFQIEDEINKALERVLSGF